MITTAQSDHRNQPKPGCTFYIDGFNFDSNSKGQWKIEGQGQTTGSFGNGAWSADGNGNWRSEDRAAPEGHYKVSAWQTLPNDPSGGDKTKVFKIDCGTSGGAGEETRGQITAAIGVATTFNAQVTGGRRSDASRVLHQPPPSGEGLDAPRRHHGGHERVGRRHAQDQGGADGARQSQHRDRIG